MSKHVLIVGGGVIGLSIAYYAMQRGHRVTVLERGAPDHDACSLGNAGMIVPSHFVPLAAPGALAFGLKSMLSPESPFYVRPRLDSGLIDWGLKFMRACTAEHVKKAGPLLRDLHLLSRQCYVELADAFANDFGLVQKGLLMLCKTEHGLHEEQAGAVTANALGIPAEVLDPAALARLDPSITMDVAGGVFYPKDCHLSPQRFVSGLTRMLLGAGMEIRWNSALTGWRQDDNGVLAARTAEGDLTADEYVITGGAWAPEVARGLRLKLPMQAGKGYSLTLPKPAQLPELCSILVEARVAVTPMQGALRVGGTMEVTGLDESINPRRVQGIVKSVPKYLPAITGDQFAGVAPWRGLRPVSPDGLPYIGRVKGYANLSVAAGHAMMGLSLAPVTGRLMADILSAKKPEIDLGMVSPNRYM